MKTTSAYQKRIIFYVLILSAILFSLSGFILVSCFRENKNRNTVLKGIKDVSGNTYLLFANGSVLNIGETETVKVADDGKTAVYTTADGIFLFDAKTKKSVFVKTGSREVFLYNSEGFVYSDSEGFFHRYLFKNLSDNVLFKDTGINVKKDIRVSDEGYNLVFTSEGKLCLMKGTSIDVQMLAEIPEEYGVFYVSNDGNTILLNKIKDNSEIIYRFSDGTITEAVSFKNPYGETGAGVLYSKADKSMVITSAYDDCMYIVNKDGSIGKVTFGNFYSNVFYTKSGKLYAAVNSDSGIYQNIVFVSKNGESEKIVSNFKKYAFFRNRLYYLDQVGNLKKSRLNGTENKNGELISDGVYSMNFANGFLYFMKNMDNDKKSGSLYISKNGLKPEKIADNVLFSNGWNDIILSGAGDESCFYMSLSTGTGYELKYYDGKKSETVIKDATEP